MATALSEEELDNEDYYSLLNVRREVRPAAGMPSGLRPGPAVREGRAGGECPVPAAGGRGRRGGRVTPSDVRDRRPIGRPPPPGPSRGGAPAACALLSAARAPRALSRRGRGPAPAGGRRAPGEETPGESQSPRTWAHARLAHPPWWRGRVVSSPPAGRMGNGVWGIKVKAPGRPPQGSVGPLD